MRNKETKVAVPPLWCMSSAVELFPAHRDNLVETVDGDGGFGIWGSDTAAVEELWTRVRPETETALKSGPMYR